jgi:hypothetical protein
MIRLLPFSSTLITAIFAAAVLLRFARRGGWHSLFWGIGLALYGLGTFSEAFLGQAWSPVMLRLWYLTGAMLTAAWLGQGTVYLLVRKPGVAHAVMVVLVLVSVAAIVAVFSARIGPAAVYNIHRPASEQYKTVMERLPLTITLTIVLNTFGTLALVGGAIYSAFIFWRKRVLPNRVIGNVLIAAGALLPAGAGTLVKLGLSDWLYLSELLGATIMFIGFLQATARQPLQATAAQPATS